MMVEERFLRHLVQTIAELAARVRHLETLETSPHKATHQDGGTDEISLAGLEGLLKWLQLTGNSKTIASGAVTTTTSLLVVDTEGGASTDDLDTIDGGATNTLLLVRTYSSTRDVVIRNKTGNIRLSGGTNMTLGSRFDSLLLLKHASGDWIEVSRSINGD